MRSHWVILCAVLFSFACSRHRQQAPVEYPNQMGEIAFDPKADNPAFKLCNENDLVHSRTSLGYEGGRRHILDISKEMIEKEGLDVNYSGYIMAHFLVNCKGEAGRFRLEAMDMGFMQQEAPEELMAAVKKVVSSLNEWTITKASNAGKDHSKYLNFKFVNGQLDAITH